MKLKWRVEGYFDDHVAFISKATMVEGSIAEWREAIACLLDCQNYEAKRLRVEFQSGGVELSSPRNRYDSDDVFFVPSQDLDCFVRELEIELKELFPD